ncbi:MAG: glycosyltransferase family 2 protein [Deltaproteobacteria bacterium]|nr:glycosyltransferase family 2 protein [Deltaproteobacteria bacterium]
MAPVNLKPFVLIPVYNHSSTIGSVVKSASKYLDVIVVDDGSSDGSGENAERAGAFLLRHGTNMGKGAALLTGMKHGLTLGYTHAISMDADGQHDSNDIPVLLNELKAHPDSLVVGNRIMQGTDAPIGSRIGRYISDFWVSIEGLTFARDAQCGFRIYPLSSILALDLRTSGFDWEIEVLVKAARAGIPIRSIPVHVSYGALRITHFDLWKDNVKLSKLNARLFMELPFAIPTISYNRLKRLLGDAGNGAGGNVSKLQELGLDAAAFMSQLLGRETAKKLVLPIVVPYYLFTRPDVRKNLLVYAYKVRPTTTKYRKVQLAGNVLREFASSLFDRYTSDNTNPTLFWDEKLSKPGLDKIKKVIENGSGAVLVTAHVGRWAQAVHILQGQGLDPIVVMDSRERDSFTRAFNRTKKIGARTFSILPVEDGINGSLESLKALKAGKLVAMMGDRPVPSANVKVKFLGGVAHFPAGPYLLSYHGHVPWFAIGPYVNHENKLVTLVEGPYFVENTDKQTNKNKNKRDIIRAAARANAQRFATLLETWCKRYPEQWFNFDYPWEGIDIRRSHGRGFQTGR